MAADEHGVDVDGAAMTATTGVSARGRAWLRGRVAFGTIVEPQGREGLPPLRVPLKNLTPIEIVAYWHDDPRVRLVANRLARKLDLNVTEVCNYDCFYCYQRSRDDDWETKAVRAAERELSIDEWIRVAEEAHALGTPRVKITGGEPLTKRGIADLIAACLSLPGFEEVELCTNASLLERHVEQLADLVHRDPSRFHVHTSIDGIGAAASRELTKASPEHLALLESLLTTSLAGIRVSVNSMWNGLLTDPTQVAALHQFMIRGGIERWTISYPYFVRDFIASSAQSADEMPSYAASSTLRAT